jgi:hypothetical protein
MVISLILSTSILSVAITRQAVCVSRDMEASSCNHCYSGKVIIVTYSGCVFVASGSQRAVRMRIIAICGVYGRTEFLHIS